MSTIVAIGKYNNNKEKVVNTLANKIESLKALQELEYII